MMDIVERQARTRGLLVALVLTALAGLLMTPVSATGVPATTSVVRDGHARFQVLSPTLIRLEYAADDRFEDRPTVTAVNRTPAPTAYTTTVEDGVRVIRTDALTLRYVQDSGPFTPDNLTVQLDVAGSPTSAKPSWEPNSNPQNLGGWVRSLDLQSGPVPEHQGVLSRAGWYLLDDSRTALLTPETVPGFTVRPTHAGGYQDGYFFGYGHDYARGLRDLRQLTGPTPLLPRKAFGVWFSKYYPHSGAEWMQIVERFRSEGVPLDTLSLDTAGSSPTPR